MKPRLDPFKTAPGVFKAMMDLQTRVNNSGLEHSLQELVKTRASQINGCAFCLHMHTRDARAAGETEERLYLLSAWRDSPLYTERERAALAWTEAMTLISQTGCARRRLQRAESKLHRGGDGRVDPAHQHDQRVEPVRSAASVASIR